MFLRWGARILITVPSIYAEYKASFVWPNAENNATTMEMEKDLFI